MRTWTRLLLGCLTLTVGAACGDSPTSPAAPPAPPAADLVPITSPLDAQIRSEIDALFPRLIGDVIGAAWNVIVAELALSRKPGLTDRQRALTIDLARRQLVVLVAVIQAKTGRITPPPGETQEHAAARLVLLMSLYVYNGPATTPPVVPPSSDAVVAIVQPSATATQTVRTPTQHAAVQFPPGSLGETRIIVISQLLTPYPVNCSGPLNTRLCQYPQFYEISSFPDTRLRSPAVAAVCHINAGDARTPLENHDAFRIAHDAPADPANYVEGGTIVDGVEVLPFVLVSGLTSCAGNSYSAGASPVAPRGALGSALRWLGRPAVRAASAIFARLAPREAWAIDGIGGGQFSVFSTFGVVDPASAPDLDVGVAPSAVYGSGEGGNMVQVGAWSVVNTGTAAARSVTATIVVAADSLLTTGVVASATLGQAVALPPGQALSGSGITVALPASLVPASYFVGIRATLDNETGLADGNLPNNLQSRRAALGGTPLGSWVGRASALTTRADAAGDAIAGKIYVVGGRNASGILSAFEAYDVEMNQWSSLKGLPIAVGNPAAAALNGKLYVAGGARDPNVAEDYIITSAFSFTPDGEIWSPIPAMSVERMSGSAAAVNGRFFVVGGETYDGVTGALEAYDPQTNSWTVEASMPTARYGAGAAGLNGILYVAGGFVDGTAYPLDTFEAYDPATHSWTTLAPMPTARGELCLAAINGLIYAVGGFSHGEVFERIGLVEAYDPQTNSWSPRASMPTPRSPGACGVVGGSIFAIGGADAHNAVSSTVERFTP